jgi:hypothetical protein
MMLEHVSENDLLLAFDGELSPVCNEAVRLHTQTCALCREKWEKWAGLKDLGEQVAGLQCLEVTFQPEEQAVAALWSRMNHAATPKKTHWATRSLVFANTLVAVAVAITCIVLFPVRAGRMVPARTAVHTPVVYDLEQAVPPGYVSLPFGDPALPLDDATVLPVDLSAEDLEMMGFDANETPPDGVRAELLIGMDGWPRAIRIVEQF